MLFFKIITYIMFFFIFLTLFLFFLSLFLKVLKFFITSWRRLLPKQQKESDRSDKIEKE